MINKLVLAGVAAMATVATAGGMAVAGNTDGGSAQAGGSAPSVSAKATTDVFRCDGGYQKAVYNRIVNQPSVYGEGSDFLVPGASLDLVGPKRGWDTLSVEFSAETQLRGNSSNDLFDWAELEVRLNGVPMQPVGPPGSPLAITGSSTYSANAAQFCGKIRAHGHYHVDVVSRIADNGNDDSLSAWIDDYTLHVERSN